jgi:23S rRNA (cytidine1920-2'-O)/16S rRNA (cytidine1409-2'-O)-methyltransferase
LTKVLPAALRLLSEGESQIVALIKPQFEAGREAVGKGGVVRSKEAHQAVLRDVIDFSAQIGLITIGITYSPLKGPAGNIEFLARWQNFGDPQPIDITRLVDEAHTILNAPKTDIKEESP